MPLPIRNNAQYRQNNSCLEPGELRWCSDYTTGWMSKKLCFNPQYREESFLFYSVKIGFGTHTVSYSMGILDITGGTEGPMQYDSMASQWTTLPYLKNIVAMVAISPHSSHLPKQVCCHHPWKIIINSSFMSCPQDGCCTVYIGWWWGPNFTTLHIGMLLILYIERSIYPL